VISQRQCLERVPSSDAGSASADGTASSHSKFPKLLLQVRAVFLDIDGTLVDSNELHVSAWAEAFVAAGYPVSAERIAQQIGKGADMLVPSLLPGISGARQRLIGTTHDEIFRSRGLPQVRPFADAAAFIERLSAAGLQVVLASSANDKEVQHYVRLLQVAHLLKATTSADDAARSKPAGDIFANALRKVAPIRPAECCAVGDTPYDAIAAANCRIRTIALRSGGFSDSELIEAGSVALYDNVGALLRSFNDLLALGNPR
jgi:phosphoglycolate phosphatase-like HAD superfamily hydrolase